MDKVTHGLRRGLHSGAASRLKAAAGGVAQQLRPSRSSGGLVPRRSLNTNNTSVSLSQLTNRLPTACAVGCIIVPLRGCLPHRFAGSVPRGFVAVCRPKIIKSPALWTSSGAFDLTDS